MCNMCDPEPTKITGRGMLWRIAPAELQDSNEQRAGPMQAPPQKTIEAGSRRGWERPKDTNEENAWGCWNTKFPISSPQPSKYMAGLSPHHFVQFLIPGF